MFRFAADLADAGAQILLAGEATPFQTADAGHDAHTAACLLNKWSRSEGGEYWSVDQDAQIRIQEAP